jgi:hypothetical protein
MMRESGSVAGGTGKMGRNSLVVNTAALIAAGILAAGVQEVRADTFLFDFGQASRLTTNDPAPDDPVNFWNNVTDTIGISATGRLLNIVTTNNTPTDIDLFMIRRFGGANANGTSASTIYPADATADNLYGNTGTFNSLANVFPSFRLVNLDPATLYSFTFYASRMSTTGNRETVYTVEGATTEAVSLNPVLNVDTTVSTGLLSPTSSGEIVISIAPGPNNNNSATYFTHLAVMRLDTTPPPPTPVAFTTEPVSQTVAATKDATFTAAVTGSGPFNVRWYQDGVEVASTNTYFNAFSYTIPYVGIYLDKAQFSVSVSNAVYGARSTNAVLSVFVDQTPPQIVSVSSPSGFNALLEFSEEMDTNTTAMISYYTVNGQPVVAAVPSLDRKNVALTFASRVTGSYTLAVSYVTDWYGNPIAEGATISGTVPELGPESFLIDFGDTSLATLHSFEPNNDPVNYWNNVSRAIGMSDTGELELLSSYREGTGIKLMMVRRFNDWNTAGTTASSTFPVNATRDSLYGNTEVWLTLTDVFPSFKITGLDPAKAYTFTFFGSRTGASDNRETAYTVEGANSVAVALDAANNVDGVAVAAGITPTASGEITISIAPTVNNNNANHFTYLNAMKFAVAEATPPVFAAPTIDGTRIQLNWTGQGQLEWAPALSGPWSQVSPAPASGYTEDIVTGQSRFYRLKR